MTWRLPPQPVRFWAWLWPPGSPHPTTSRPSRTNTSAGWPCWRPASRCNRAASHRPLRLGPERRDLRLLRFAQLARNLALVHLGGLDLVTDALHHFGVGQRGDVADVGEVGHRGDDPAHDLPGPGFGHVRDDPHVLGPGDLADLGLDRGGH